MPRESSLARLTPLRSRTLTRYKWDRPRQHRVESFPTTTTSSSSMQCHAAVNMQLISHTQKKGNLVRIARKILDRPSTYKGTLEFTLALNHIRATCVRIRLGVKNI